MTFGSHNIHDVWLFLLGRVNRLVMKAIYRAQVVDQGIRQLDHVPLIRYGRGHVSFGAGAVIRGRLTVVLSPKSDGLLSLGERFVLTGNASINPREGAIEVGDDCSIGSHCVLQATLGSKITIGDNVMIAHGVSIVASNHGMKTSQTMNAQPETGLGIRVGKDVWIGAHAVLLDGAEIGDGAVVAAGAVVRGNVDAMKVVGGVPARVISVR